MKAFSGYEEAKKSASFSNNEKLPSGAYVVKVMAVKYEEGKNGASDRIAVQFDITEGEFKDFYKKQYEANQNDEKRWKGSTRIYVPKDDGTERDGWTKNAFAKWTSSFEKSNLGYTWDWDEKKWKNKTIGLVFREVGNVIDGKAVRYTEVAFPVDADSVRNGSAPSAKFKEKNGYIEGMEKQNKTKPNDEFMAIAEDAPEAIPF